MATAWNEPAAILLVRGGAESSGAWSILDTAAHAALALSLETPASHGVDLAFAAMDLAEARDEIDWARPDLARGSRPVRLGPLTPTDDHADARALVAAFVEEAAARAERLRDAALEPAERSSFDYAARRCHAALAHLRRASR